MNRSQVRVRSGFRCCCRAPFVDEEILLLTEILSLKKKIRELLILKRQKNIGKAFVMFSDENIVKDFQFFGDNHFNKLTKTTIPNKVKKQLKMKSWKFRPVSGQSDILWEGLSADEDCALIKTVMLLFILFIVSVLLISPLMLSKAVTDWANSRDLLVNYISVETIDTYLQTLCVALVNVVLIPFFIDMMVLIEDFQTKSQRQISILNRNFVFMLLNSLLLPLTET
jgi:hypothetical protein